MKESTPKSTITWSEMGTTNIEGKEVYRDSFFWKHKSLEKVSVIVSSGSYLVAKFHEMYVHCVISVHMTRN